MFIIDTVLGIDLGTSACRSAVFDNQLNILGASYREYPLIYISSTHIEQDPEDWWSIVKLTLCEAIRNSGISSHSIRSIALSSQGISVVPVDKVGHALSNAISWLDTRASSEVEQLKSRYGSKMIYELSGKRLTETYSLPKLMWIKDNQPDIYERTYKFLLPLDYIELRLCGEYVTDHTMAAGTMYYDIKQQNWATDILAECDIDKQKLPNICWSGTPIGRILPTVAKELGLDSNTLIVQGAQDQKCAAYAAGVSSTVVTVSLGTASSITQICNQPVFDPKIRIPCFSFVSPFLWDIESIIGTAGAAYNWFRNTCGSGMGFDQLSNIEKNLTDEQCVFFYPYLTGMLTPFWKDGSGAFIGITLATTTGHLVRSIFEGIACNIRTNLEIMSQIYKPSQEMRLFGGGVKSDSWCQYIANITNIPIKTLSTPETALAGAAMLAAQGSIIEIPKSLPISKEYLPNIDMVSKYDDYYKRYEETRCKLFNV